MLYSNFAQFKPWELNPFKVLIKELIKFLPDPGWRPWQDYFLTVKNALHEQLVTHIRLWCVLWMWTSRWRLRRHRCRIQSFPHPPHCRSTVREHQSTPGSRTRLYLGPSRRYCLQHNNRTLWLFTHDFFFYTWKLLANDFWCCNYKKMCEQEKAIKLHIPYRLFYLDGGLES